MKTIVLTGGGTAGHVTPNIALLPRLAEDGWNIKYVGAHNGIEKELIEKENISYYSVSTGKLRRYLSIKNITDIFKVAGGIKDSIMLLRRLKPDVVFSKGGFVAVPVILGAKLNKIPVVIHESDITPGLANKIALPFAEKVCTTFPETLKYLPKDKGVLTGTPIREELFFGDKKKGLELCGFNETKPVVMVMGGSLGSVNINNNIRKIIKEITKDFQLVHICGKGNVDSSLAGTLGYAQFEYISEELPHIFAIASIVVSRAGSNSISEFLALRKPNILIPLSLKSSRGDQILNAGSFEKQGYSVVINEDDLSHYRLLSEIRNLYLNKDEFIYKMGKSDTGNSVDKIVKILSRFGKGVV